MDRSIDEMTRRCRRIQKKYPAFERGSVGGGREEQCEKSRRRGVASSAGEEGADPVLGIDDVAGNGVEHDDSDCGVPG